MEGLAEKTRRHTRLTVMTSCDPPAPLQFHTDHDNFDDWQLGQGGFRMDWDNQGRDSITLQGDLYKGGVRARQNLAFYSPPASINVDGTQDVSGGNILGRWRRKLRRSVRLPAPGVL